MGLSIAAFVAEYAAMLFLVVIGNGTAMGVAEIPGLRLQEALAFGLATVALMYAVVQYSGGHMNCAVTLAVMIAGHCSRRVGLANICGQLLGGISGAALLCIIFPPGQDASGMLGANTVRSGYSLSNVLIAETVMTLFMVFVYLEVMCSPKSIASRAQACAAVGFTVFLGHCAVAPVDGCSANPSRSLGIAALAWARYGVWEPMRDLWIFWVGPLLGALAAAGLHSMLQQCVEEAPDMAKHDSGASNAEWGDSPVMHIPTASPRDGSAAPSTPARSERTPVDAPTLRAVLDRQGRDIKGFPNHAVSAANFSSETSGSICSSAIRMGSVL